MGLPKVAYLSMEIAMDQSLCTYSGGLGFLAGSHMQSAGYLQMPMVGVTMLWSYGYYDQRIDHEGNVEVAYIRKHYDFLTDLNVEVEIIEVSYDNEKMAKEIEENEILPNDFARLIRQGSSK